ncbi:NAD(P)H-dependent oxidoreductase [Archangium violaceum]|uniref:NADPH-dependent FMN reductase n=1 Tax=Archangium violaceum TaxID=83451 RepID=UPI002B2CD18F|nr:NAD(P)H-dependent oxidoreductase [Archangium violaceum]
MERKMKVALIYGSTREGRFCDTVAKWAAAEIARQGMFTVEVVDPAALALPGRYEQKAGAEVLALNERLAGADAFIVVTPEYNHGYPASLKLLIDAVHTPWQAKPVAFVSYGGISGGLRAVEQLRQVFAELHAVTLRDCVSFSNAWQQFNEAGELREPEPARKAMTLMLSRLGWWTKALRDAREATPYK